VILNKFYPLEGMTMKYLKRAILLTLLVSTNTFGVVLWDTGAPVDGSIRCDARCGFTEWELLGEFTATENWNITGLTFFSVSGDYALTSKYTSTDWRISTGTPASLTDIFSGTASATITDLGNSLWQFDIVGLNLSLTSGTFWLGHHHGFDIKTVTAGAISSNFGSFIQYEHNGPFNGPGSGELAQRITGDIVRNVPEPSIIILFGLGLAGIGFARKKKT